MSAREEFLAGARAQLPIILGAAPFGMIYGALAMSAGLSPAAAQAMSAIVFAGSSQFIGAGLFAAGAPWPVIVLTTLVVNLRHALYSASVAPFVAHLPARWKVALAYLLTDEAYAVAIQRLRAPGETRERHWYILGTGLALWVSWQLATAVGVFLGAQVPAGWGLDFALPLTFIALLVPTLGNRPTALAALVAAAAALLGAGLPYKLGLLAAACTGIAAGMIAARALARAGVAPAHPRGEAWRSETPPKEM
ncbi:MAG TPA: AzlC family ABC transporter permease [Roseiflexaceae bacterium]|nr:AzlC family ABC transporter permease [Roseiflexaceae bacterium]